MKLNLKKFLVAASLANLVLIGEWFNLFAPFTLLNFSSHPVIYITSISGILLAFLYLTVSLYLLFEVRLAVKTPFLKGTILLFFLTLLLIPLNTLRMYSNVSAALPFLSLKAIFRVIHHPIAWLASVLVVVGSIVLLLKEQERVWRFFQLVGKVGIPLLVLNLTLLTYDSYRSIRYGGTYIKRHGELKQEQQGRPRIVWFIFDEFDYRIAFEKRPDWLKMPHWDKIMSESFSATNATPPGLNTLTSVPGLLTGIKFYEDDLLGQLECKLKVDAASERVPLGQFDNVFRTSKQKGFTTALFGWTLPYCQIYNKELDRCAISKGEGFNYSSYAMTTFAQVIKRTFAPLGHYSVNAASFDFTVEQSIKIVSKEHLDLAFLHLSFPHAPWIYDAMREEVVVWHPRPHQGYKENLALAEKYFGMITKELEKTSRFDNTVLIVSSDHSWRNSPERDFRVPFIVHMPDRKHIRFDKPLKTIWTRSLVEAIQDGKVKTTEDVKAFFETKI